MLEGEENKDEANNCMRSRKLDVIRSRGHHRYYVVVANFTDPELPKCHVCTGRLGLIVLSDEGSRLRLVARNNLREEFGSWGAINDNYPFILEKLGPAETTDGL